MFLYPTIEVEHARYGTLHAYCHPKGEEASSTSHSAGVVFDDHGERLAPLSGAADRGEEDSPLVWGRSRRMDYVYVVLSGAFAGWLCLRPYARDASLTASASPGAYPLAPGFVGDFT